MFRMSIRIGSIVKSAKNSYRAKRKESLTDQLTELRLKEQTSKEEVFSLRLELSKLLHEIMRETKSVKLMLPRFNTPNQLRAHEKEISQANQAGMDYSGKVHLLHLRLKISKTRYQDTQI
jgi:hypothetical protein